MTQDVNETYDAVVIGGGAAGLSGATALARSRRSVLVIDAGEPRNAPAEGVHGFLSRDGMSPQELLAEGRAEVEKYGGRVVSGRVRTVRGSSGSFEIIVDDDSPDTQRADTERVVGDGGVGGGVVGRGVVGGGVDGRGVDGGGVNGGVVGDGGVGGGVVGDGVVGGRVVSARRLLLTTGLVDELPAVPGVRELWGRDVVHCPYCHGWEVRDRPIGVLGTSPQSVHQALLFRQLTDDLVFFAIEPVTPEAAVRLTARGIRIVEGPVAALESENGHLTGVRIGDGTIVERTAAVVTPEFVAQAGVLTELGLKTVPHPMGGEVVEVDPMARTSVPGVFAAGNVVDPSAQVVIAAGAGLRAGAMINFDLVNEETEQAMSDNQHEHQHQHQHQHQHGEDVDIDAMFTQEHWDARYGESDRMWSGNPNAALVEEVEGLTAGTALEVGSGEGADAVWLAGHGWRVTALDISEVALAKGAAHAEQAGVGDRITWKQYDARSGKPVEGTYDLVTAHFMHLPQPDLGELQQRLAAAVAPGGSLLLVGHHPMDLATSHPLWQKHPDMRFTGEEVAATLPAEQWKIKVVDTRARERKHPETGELMTIHDAVLRAVRRP